MNSNLLIEEELSDEQIALLIDNYDKLLKDAAKKLNENYNTTIFYY